MVHVLRYAIFVKGAKTAELKSVRNKAADAVVDFIRFPDQYQFDLLEADAVVQLREDPEFSTLYQLLSILLRSDNIKVGLAPLRSGNNIWVHSIGNALTIH